MANDLTTNEDALLARYFSEQGAADSKRRFIGDLLKYAKGEFLYGEEGHELDLGKELVVCMLTYTKGWVKWQGGKPVDHRVGLVMEGFREPRRDELGDNDPAGWETDSKTKQPKNPWQPVRYVVMVDPKTKTPYTFTTGSQGGIGALGELCSIYGQRVRMAPDEVPVVALGSSSYRHDQYGKVFFPTFKVINWVAGKPYMDVVNEARGLGNVKSNGQGEDFFPAPEGEKKSKQAAPKQIAKPTGKNAHVAMMSGTKPKAKAKSARM